MWRVVGAARDRDLARLLHLTEAILTQRDVADEPRLAARKVFKTLTRRAGTAAQTVPQRLPVCGCLDAVYRDMEAAPAVVRELAAAFRAIEPRLSWWRRPSAEPADAPFYDGHANAMIIGKGGLEQRDDVQVGVTLMAPDILYPDHSHPPEEVYVAFTEGEWWNAEMEWTAPGAGGLIYNPPGILHAMRSVAKPFLALWLLPVE